ncbi:MAG: hypothetical protein GC184_09455 [Rhizobiales bacterium]|nr:hypothetical protein [Hyphomicrobiales bacterium]
MTNPWSATTRLTLFLVLSLTLAACAGNVNAPSAPPSRTNISSLPSAAVAQANLNDPAAAALTKAISARRAEKGLPPLVNDATLSRAAATHSTDMALRGFFGHYNPDGQGPKERVLALAPDSKNIIVGENVITVQGQSFAVMSPELLADALVSRWIASPPHRKNIEDKTYRRSGIGIARKGEQIWATEVFAAP